MTLDPIYQELAWELGFAPLVWTDNTTDDDENEVAA